MATQTQTEGGKRVGCWMPSNLADEVKAQARRERRSVSNLVRLAVENRLDAAVRKQ